jgi:transcriptional regulator with XRE-family HTH domain
MMTNWITLMAESDFRKKLGARIKKLRKQHKLTQKELAAAVGITYGQLNKYESGLNNPSPEILIKIADQLHISLDVLMTGHQPDNIPITNARLIERMKALEEVQPQDQEAIITLIDAIIVKHRAGSLLAPVDKSAQAS